MKLWLHIFWQLTLLILSCNSQSDGSSPEEICPCQSEESCLSDRHIFGRDPLDIQNFGLISPCRKHGDFPCCPEKPPPPKKIQLTAKDLQGFTQAELLDLGVSPDQLLANNQLSTIGSSSLPLSEDNQFVAQNNKIPSIDLNQPGAASLAPHGALQVNKKEPQQQRQQQVIINRPVYQPQQFYHQPYPVYSRPSLPARPVYYYPALLRQG